MSLDSIWRFLSVSIQLLSISFGFFGNILFILVLLREKVLRKLAIVPLLVAYSVSSLAQTVFIELLAFHSLITNDHLGHRHHWVCLTDTVCQAHQAAGYFFIPCSALFLTFISFVRWLHHRGTPWIRRPRARRRVFTRMSIMIIAVCLFFSSIVFSGVQFSPNQFLFCDAYSNNQTLPNWFYAWDSGIALCGFISPAFVTCFIYVKIYNSKRDDKMDEPVRKPLFRRHPAAPLRNSSVTKGLLVTFIYGLLVNIPVIIGRHFVNLSINMTHFFTAVSLTNNSVVLLAFLIFCEVFRKGAKLELWRLLKRFGLKVNDQEEAVWIPVWSGMRNKYIWVQTTYIDQTDVKCSILLCEKRPGRQPIC